MLFNSIEYLIFFPIVFTIYWLLRKQLKLQNTLLLFASYFFYGLWDYRFLSLIIFSSICDYILGLQIDKATAKSKKKVFVAISLFVNLGLLLTFKYYNFFIDNFMELSNMLGFTPNINSIKVILPVGISFYTFQTLSYTIDIYRGTLKPSNSIVNFFTYVAFFPQLVAGPIERASRLLPQIEKPRFFDYKESKDGLRQILWGLFKKVVIADNCATYVNLIFESYTEASSMVLILGAVLFAFQIYCDFSGYSDIAIGSAKLLGINLMQNFATPYFARDIAEFWRRWHISLSGWFRDYLYIPLGGSRVSRLKKIRNIFAIFLVSGFWHGANWTFIIWGLLHSLFYLPSVFTNSNRKFMNTVAESKHLPSIIDIVHMLKTFTIVCLAWIFFRAQSLTEAVLYVKNIFTNFNAFDYNTFGLSDQSPSLLLLAVFIFIVLLFEWFNRTKKHGLEILPKQKYIRYIIYILLSLLIIQYFSNESSFIYFQF